MRSVRSVCQKIFVLFGLFVFKKLRYVVYMGRWGHIGDWTNFNVLCLFA